MAPYLAVSKFAVPYYPTPKIREFGGTTVSSWGHITQAKENIILSKGLIIRGCKMTLISQPPIK